MKFAGKEVVMREAINQETGEFYGMYVPDQSDPVLQEMKKTAEDSGLSLRVWFPGMRGSKDYRTDRVNATVEQAVDGKWRIADKFDLW